MKYKDYKHKSDFSHDYKWVIVDEEFGDLLSCSRCRSEVPVQAYRGISSNEPDVPMCEICANTHDHSGQLAEALNAMLRIMNVFDDREVVTVDEAGLREYWDSEQ